MDGNTLNIVLAVLSIASILGAASAVFYGVRNKTIITTLQESNNAYRERNGQLEDDVKALRTEVAALTSKVETLIKLKSPDIGGLARIMKSNHEEVIELIKGNA